MAFFSSFYCLSSFHALHLPPPPDVLLCVVVVVVVVMMVGVWGDKNPQSVMIQPTPFSQALEHLPYPHRHH
jgi:hypothetical protein